MVKNLPAKAGDINKMQVRSLGPKDALEEDVATESGILGWRLPTHRGAWQATVHRVAKSRTWLKPLGMHCITVSGCLTLRD